jgi:hypothetical protein
MEYKDFGYLYPPRPENAIPSGLINSFEKRGWWGQIKKNGACTVIFTNGKEVIFKTRHADDHKLWEPTPEILQFFAGKKRAGKWNVYVAELLHNKVSGGLKNHLYIFDKIVHDGVQLVGTTFEHRQKILQKQIPSWAKEWLTWTDGTICEFWDRTDVHENVSVAKSFTSGLKFAYDRIAERNDNPEDEGLVLKNPTGILKPCFSQSANDGWMVKVRLPKKNFGF